MNMKWKSWPEWKKKRTIQIISRCALITLTVFVMTLRITSIGHAETLSEKNTPVTYHSHYVKSGETLWDIAKIYSKEGDIREYIDEISSINQIKNKNDIQYGTYIIVPIYE